MRKCWYLQNDIVVEGERVFSFHVRPDDFAHLTASAVCTNKEPSANVRLRV